MCGCVFGLDYRWVKLYEYSGITQDELDKHQHLKAWLTRISERPAVQTGSSSKYRFDSSLYLCLPHCLCRFVFETDLNLTYHSLLSGLWSDMLLLNISTCNSLPKWLIKPGERRGGLYHRNWCLLYIPQDFTEPMTAFYRLVRLLRIVDLKFRGSLQRATSTCLLAQWAMLRIMAVLDEMNQFPSK